MSAPLRRDGAGDLTYRLYFAFVVRSKLLSFLCLFFLPLSPSTSPISFLDRSSSSIRISVLSFSHSPFSLSFSFSSILLAALSSLLLFSHPTVNHTPLHDVRYLLST